MDANSQITPRSPDIERILTTLENKDKTKILLRPDQDGIYTPEAFIKNLELSEKELKKHLVDYCDLGKHIIKGQLTQKKNDYIEPNSYAKNMPTDPSKVMFLLFFSVNPKKTADIRRVEGKIWILQKMYSMITGANLLNSNIEPNIVGKPVTYDCVQRIKRKVKKDLQKIKATTFIQRYENTEEKQKSPK